ncbi:hypothetical protein BH10BAC3_BH10BAC3_30810 [soil metagenome]
MKKKTFKLAALLLGAFIMVTACQKEPPGKVPDKTHGHLKQTNTYNSEVVAKWLEVQASMLYRPSGNPLGFNPLRYMAYFGVALYESVVPGMPSYRSLQGQLTDMPAMPSTKPGVAYHWPTCAHAALAEMTRKFYGMLPAGVYNEAGVDMMENQLNSQLLAETNKITFDRSTAFGKEVATRVFEWSKTEKAAWPTIPYQLPAYYPGLYQTESGAPVNPYWGYNRLMVPGSLNNTVSPPLTYSTDVASLYYQDMYEVYMISKNLTHEEKLIAKYFNDVNPGFPAGGHYISVFKQLVEQLNPSLDKTALAYAKTGITLMDASTGSFKTKYQYLTERPFSFIRTVIAPVPNPPSGQWVPFLSTPPFPDYPSNHSLFGNAVAAALNSVFGNKTGFTDASYEGVMADLGNGPENLGSRHYASFDEMAAEITISRLYGGIHYRYSCEVGGKQGRKIAQNIHNTLVFQKP